MLWLPFPWPVTVIGLAMFCAKTTAGPSEVGFRQLVYTSKPARTGQCSACNPSLLVRSTTGIGNCNNSRVNYPMKYMHYIDTLFA